jgi:4-amino-4-deoxy-L-arabinose transferase-like glycosyltransferase
VIAAATAFYLAWEVAHRGIYLYTQSIYKVDDADEWRYVACSRLLLHGYRLFDQVFSAQPPLLFASLATGMRAFGDNIGGARWVEILFGLLTIACSGWIAARLAGRWGAAAAVLLLCVSPAFLIYSHTVEAEGPMMALGTLSLALALQSRRATGVAGVWWAAAAGLALAAALLLKFFAAEALLPGIWALAASRRSGRSAVSAIAAYLAAFTLPVGLNFLLIAPARQWQQVVELHNQAASAHLPDLIPAPTIVWNFLTVDAGLSVLAAGGIVILAVRRRWFELGFAGLWLGGTILMLLLFRPLFPHHAAILLAPLAVMAGTGVGCGMSVIGTTRGRGSGTGAGATSVGDGGFLRGRSVAAVLLIGMIAYLGLAVRIVHDDRHALYAPGSTSSDALAAFIDLRTGATDLIIADDVRAAEVANRLVAPPLCDPSTVRLKSGYLTASEAIRATRSYRVRLVAPTTGLYAQVPGYVRWVRAHFRVAKGPGGVKVFLAPKK